MTSGGIIKSLNFSLKNTHGFEPVIKYMAPYLSDFTEKFRGIGSTGKLQLALAEWYFDNKRYAQGYICLTESIITRLLEIYREKDITIRWNNYNRMKIRYLIMKHLKNDEMYYKIYEVYDTVRQIRNTIAHAGYTKNNSFTEDINNAYKHLNNVKVHVFDNPSINEIPNKIQFSDLVADNY